MYYNSTYFKDNDGLVFKVYTHLCFSFLLKKRVIPLSWHVRGAQWLASRELSVVKGLEGNAKPDCGFHVGVQSLPTLSASRPSLGRKPHQKAALQRWGACAMWGYWGSQRWGPHGKRQASRQPHAGAQKQIFHSWALKWLQSEPTAWRWHQERGCQAPHCPPQTDWEPPWAQTLGKNSSADLNLELVCHCWEMIPWTQNLCPSPVALIGLYFFFSKKSSNYGSC